MNTSKAAGRIIGILVLAQAIGGATVNFGLLASAFAAPGFLVNAAEHSFAVRVAAFLGIALGILGVGIAITAFGVFRQYSRSMALWLFALAVAALSLSAIENIHVLSLLSLSEAYSKASVADRGVFELLRPVYAAGRNSAHYVGLLIAGCTLLMLYGTLLRFALIPRALAAFGLGAVLLQIIAVAMPIFGHDIVFVMLLPLGLSQLMLASWLIAKGLPEPVSQRITERS